MLRDIEPVRVSFIGLEDDDIVSATIPIIHFTWCFDLMMFGLAPIACVLGKANDKDNAIFGGYAMLAGQEREYYPEQEVVRALTNCGLDRESAKELLDEVNNRNVAHAV
ncbi:hypothetical protein LCGC14_0318480 [marine sediment metagenome]|uniref:Uncharacterized protein n=1 Tax=marine sediment metagenome TaxID=412755 RepID=A0A0F9WS27_9ZZZZ